MQSWVLLSSRAEMNKHCAVKQHTEILLNILFVKELSWE